jgi:hypothetical protein
MELDEFEKFVLLMRKHGVHYAKCGDFEAQLGPQVPREYELPQIISEPNPRKEYTVPAAHIKLLEQIGQDTEPYLVPKSE